MSKKQEILNKYIGLNKKKKSSFEKLVDADTTPTTKYADYMCRLMLTKAENDKYTVSMIVKLIKDFDAHIPFISNKDIYSKDYLFYNNARQIVDKAILDKEDSVFDRDKHVKVMVDNDDIFLCRVLTIEGSIKYGSNTKWCISAKKTHNPFLNYSRNNFIYFLIRKQPQNNIFDKIAILVNKSNPIMDEKQWWTTNDRTSDSGSLMKSNWSVSELVEINNIVTADSVVEYRINRAKTSVDEFVNTLEKLSFRDLTEDLRILENNDNAKVEMLEKKFTNIVELLKNKIK
jgi:hypothetical protein